MDRTDPIPEMPATAPEDVSGPWIEVDLAAVARNARRIHRWCGRPLMPVIKANAYGHGLVPVARRLAETEGVTGLCVGNLREAVALRKAGLELPVLNLGPFTAAEAEVIVALDIAQSVFTEAVAALDRAAAAQGRAAAVHVKIDTGLGRIGMPHDRAADFILHTARLKHVRIAGIFTTLSEDPDFDALQLERFAAALAAPDRAGIPLEADTLEFTLRRNLERMAARLAKKPDDLTLLERLTRGVELAVDLPFPVRFQQLQNVHYQLAQGSYPKFKQKADKGADKAREWVEIFHQLAEFLKIRIQ